MSKTPELGFQKIQRQMVDAIRHPNKQIEVPGIEKKRLSVYHRLIFNGFEDSLARVYPITKRCVGENWISVVEHFLATHNCEVRLTAQIAEEFLSYLESSNVHEAVSGSLWKQLAHYEWVELDLWVRAGDLPLANRVKSSEEFANAQVVLNTRMWLLAYEYPVHEASVETMPLDAAPTFLVVYRSPEERVEFLKLNPLSYRLLSMLQYSEAETFSSIVAELSVEINESQALVLEEGAKMLMNWQESGLVLGIK